MRVEDLQRYFGFDGSGNIEILESKELAGYATDAELAAATGGAVDTANSPLANEFARFTDFNTIEGRTVAETKTDLSLNNVNNTSDADKPVSTAQAAADAAVLSTAQAYTDSSVVGLIDDRGNYDASVNLFPSTGGSGGGGSVKKGDLWTVSVAGTLGGNAVTTGDLVRALVDTPGQTSSNWALTENNIGYVAENSANKDASGGYTGKTGHDINFTNVAGTVVSKFRNTATAERRWTFQDRDGVIADDIDLAGKQPLDSNLTAIAALSTTAYGRALLELANAAALTALSNTFTDVLKGLVPASGGGTTNFLRADGTFAAPPGGGFTMDVEDEGVSIQVDPAVMNFVGAGVTATALLGEVTVTIPGGASDPAYAYGSFTVTTGTSKSLGKRYQNAPKHRHAK